ncbi:MAG: hypothetical protein RIC12_01790 [Pirellulales bacterium]
MHVVLFAAASRSIIVLGGSLACAAVAVLWSSPPTLADDQHGSIDRCIVVEVYLVGDAQRQKADMAFVEQSLAERHGVLIRPYRIDEDEQGVKRYRAICDHFKMVADGKQPILYGCGQPVVIFEHDRRVTEKIRDLFRCELFVRTGCSRCAEAKPWVQATINRFPALELEMQDVMQDRKAAQRVVSLARNYGTAAASYPVLHLCQQLVVGWDGGQITGSQIEKILSRWSVPCPQEPEAASPSPIDGSQEATTGKNATATLQRPVAAQVEGMVSQALFHQLVAGFFWEHSVDESIDPLPIGGLPVPGEANDEANQTNNSFGNLVDDTITLPWIGEVRVSELGMPLFTLSVGLIDGFNPCAMWVLLFLLAVLVNLKSRSKMLAVAGTFVIISGVAYFAFIAAWLNVLGWIGLLRPVQITLAVLAIVVGTVHVKDFFAFHRGISFSIPESAKPGIYARVRSIVSAENLSAAIAGAAVLAVLVNIVELLCTAGLPALYSQILTMQGLPWWQNYLYLLLYILAYMFDDTLMVAAVVATMGRPKMQETHGRWLKLLSGTVILALGLVMLLRPGWLI